MNSSDYTSNISKEEHAVFFRTTASLDPTGSHWILPIHGWIYRPKNSRIRKRIVSEVFRRRFELTLTPENSDTFSKQLNLLIAYNGSGKRIIVRMGSRTFTLPRSKANGHFHGAAKLSLDEAARISKDGVIPFEAILPQDDQREFSGECLLQAESGISVISDIDDTVKVTHVAERRRLLEHTFFKSFASVEGMSAFYQSLAREGVTFNFVSSSPWQFYQPLSDFLKTSGFPWAALTLKTVRFRDETLFNLFRKGMTTKPVQIEPILQAYPKRKFILIGDSGEHDPEVYGDFARKYPERVTKILIRNITAEELDNQRMGYAMAGTPESLWALFDDPAKIDVDALLNTQSR